MAMQEKRSSREMALEKMKEDYRRVKENSGISTEGAVSRKKDITKKRARRWKEE